MFLKGIDQNLWFTDVFRGYRPKPAVCNGLNRVLGQVLCNPGQDTSGTHPSLKYGEKKNLQQAK